MWEIYLKIGLPLLAVMFLVGWLVIGLTPLYAAGGALAGAAIGYALNPPKDDEDGAKF